MFAPFPKRKGKSFYSPLMKTWVIPDVHGCLLTLQELLEGLIRLEKDDTLIFLGDLIDRGPDSKGVLDYVMKLQDSGIKITVLRGNHEDYMAKVFVEENKKPVFLKVFGLKTRSAKEWLFHGGKQTMKSFESIKPAEIPQKYLDWIENLEYFVETEKFLIVHAGFNFKNDDIFADKRTMMWARDFEIDPLKVAGRRIIHGHVPVTLEFIFQSVKSSAFPFIDLDNGVYMPEKPGYGNLLALELGSMELVVQPNIDG